MTDDILVHVTNNVIAIRVAARCVMCRSKVRRASGTIRARMIHHALICAADRGLADGVAARSVTAENARFSNWAVHALVTEHLLISVTENNITTSIGTRSILTMPVRLTSGARQACVTNDLLV
jgi:hypothetical protein